MSLIVSGNQPAQNASSPRLGGPKETSSQKLMRIFSKNHTELAGKVQTQFKAHIEQIRVLRSSPDRSDFSKLHDFSALSLHEQLVIYNESLQYALANRQSNEKNGSSLKSNDHLIAFLEQKFAAVKAQIDASSQPEVTVAPVQVEVLPAPAPLLLTAPPAEPEASGEQTVSAADKLQVPSTTDASQQTTSRNWQRVAVGVGCAVLPLLAYGIHVYTATTETGSDQATTSYNATRTDLGVCALSEKGVNLMDTIAQATNMLPSLPTGGALAAMMGSAANSFSQAGSNLVASLYQTGSNLFAQQAASASLAPMQGLNFPETPINETAPFPHCTQADFRPELNERLMIDSSDQVFPSALGSQELGSLATDVVSNIKSDASTISEMVGNLVKTAGSISLPETVGSIHLAETAGSVRSFMTSTNMLSSLKSGVLNAARVIGENLPAGETVYNATIGQIPSKETFSNVAQSAAAYIPSKEAVYNATVGKVISQEAVVNTARTVMQQVQEAPGKTGTIAAGIFTTAAAVLAAVGCCKRRNQKRALPNADEIREAINAPVRPDPASFAGMKDSYKRLEAIQFLNNLRQAGEINVGEATLIDWLVQFVRQKQIRIRGAAFNISGADLQEFARRHLVFRNA